MEKREINSIIFFITIIIILNSINIVIADSITYTQAQIQAAGAGLPSNGYEFYATVATATKICELKDPTRPIVESFGRPSSVVTRYTTLSHDINTWDTSTNTWIITPYDYDGCIRKPILRTLTCRSNETGEISRLIDPNRAVITWNQLMDIYLPTLGVLNKDDDTFGSEIETARKICIDHGYLDILDFELHAFCNGGDYVAYYDNLTNTWSKLNYDAGVGSTLMGYIQPTLTCKTCSPKTCSDIINGAAASCGTYQDGCGGQITCGGCDITTQGCNLTIGQCYNLPIIPPNCTTFQSLFRIDTLDNTTISLYNESGTGYNICYENIFNQTHTDPAPHDCTSSPSNVIFWLNGANNSDISIARRVIISPADLNNDYRINNKDRLILIEKLEIGTVIPEVTVCNLANDWCNFTDFNQDGIFNRTDMDFFVSEDFSNHNITWGKCINNDMEYTVFVNSYIITNNSLPLDAAHLYGYGANSNGDNWASPIDIALQISRNNFCNSTGREIFYDTPVCYGDLRCEYQLTDCDLSNNESLVGYLDINLSDYNNNVTGHFQPPTYTGGEFPTRICCRPETSITGFLGTAHWANFIDSNEFLNETNIGDSVFLVFDKPGLQNEEILYEIYKQGTIGWNFFEWFDRKILQMTGRGYTTWTTNIEGNFKFKATVISTGQSLESNILEVMQPANNNPPTVRLINPNDETNYTIGLIGDTGDITFIHESNDSDDLLNITWNFGDGNITTYTNHAEGAPGWQTGEVTHRFTTPGAKRITIIVTERERGQTAESSILIYIYQSGLSMQTIIDSPSADASGPGIFFVSGNRTFVSNCTRNGASSAIVQTACNEDQNYKVTNGYISYHGDCTQNFENDNMMWCYKYASVYNATGNDINRNRFNFTWFFDQEVESGYSNGDTFYHTFLTQNKHYINLRAAYRLS
ncbi:MAG: PKD domain-containing protein [Candidatus Pacearchaeota archaeon]|jgi:hypothetical protein